MKEADAAELALLSEAILKATALFEELSRARAEAAASPPDLPADQLAEGQHGHFTLLPRHADVVTVLVPGLLAWLDDEERFAAVDGGLLIKRGADVTIATERAVVGSGLGELRRTVEQDFRATDERERVARGAMARLEVDFIQRFMALEERTRV